MRRFLILLAAMTTPAIFAPFSFDARAMGVDLQDVAIPIADRAQRSPGNGRDGAVAAERRIFEEREAGLACRTVTVRRADGSGKPVRRCD